MSDFKFVPKNSYTYDELLACSKGRLFGPGNAKLPLPPMLMFDSITHIDGETVDGRCGQVCAQMDIDPKKWFFDCHFFDDPVMPGCLGLDAMWQMVGFFLGWSGGKGYGRALGVQEVKFSGMVLPTTKKVEYEITIKRLMSRRITIGLADGIMKADGSVIYIAKGLKVGLFSTPEAEEGVS